jgi:VIT1/CCC1 family predicted Fe2+/Mn2+ transporter
MATLPKEYQTIALTLQRGELTESIIYEKISRFVKDEHNSKVLSNIGKQERKHHDIWETYTKEKVTANKWKIFIFILIARIFGFTFAVKLMEKQEGDATQYYLTLQEVIPEAKKIAEDEEHHEHALLQMLKEGRLEYVGSMVLGLSDALVELSGTLAGLTFALQNNKLIALSGLITGISATLSMASSEFLSSRAEGNNNAFTSGLYTGGIYLLTVALLVLPYLILPSSMYMLSLVLMLAVVLLVILTFTFYISVAMEVPFVKRFVEMAGISISVALISFGIGIVVKALLGIDV